MGNVLLSESLGKQVFDLPSVELLPRHTKHFLGLLIGEDDPLVRVYEEDCVGERVQQLPMIVVGHHTLVAFAPRPQRSSAPIWPGETS